MTVSPSVLDYVAHLPPTAHAVFCYENVETVREVLESYLEGSRESKSAVCILSSSRESFDDFLQSLKLRPQFAEHRLDLIEMSKFSSKSKGIDHEIALDLAKSRLDATKRLGFNGLRIFTLANDYLDYATAESVLKFERQLGQNFPIPIAAICGYDLAEAAGRWDPVLLELLKAHGSHIFKGLAGSDRDGAH